MSPPIPPPVAKEWRIGGIQPKSDSSSPKEQRLAEYREMMMGDPTVQVITDRTKDPGIFWKPAPYDPRFPNINITKYCFLMYKDFFRCRKLRGDDYEPCEYFKNAYGSLCPSAWIEEWDEQRANGCWFGDIQG